MRTTIFVVTAIIVLAIVLKLGWRPRSRTHWGMIVGGILALGFIFWIPSCVSDRAKAKAEMQAHAAALAKARAEAPVQTVVQLPDRTTPCTIDIKKVQDIYTDGEAVYMLPPGWPRDKAILYSGKGHLVVEGGNIHAGTWEFWSADPARVALIRIFAVN